MKRRTGGWGGGWSCQRWGNERIILTLRTLTTEESVAQSKSARSGKPRLSTMERCHHMDRKRSVLGFFAQRFPRSQIICGLYKNNFGETLNPGPPYVYTFK